MICRSQSIPSLEEQNLNWGLKESRQFSKENEQLTVRKERRNHTIHKEARHKIPSSIFHSQQNQMTVQILGLGDTENKIFLQLHAYLFSPVSRCKSPPALWLSATFYFFQDSALALLLVQPFFLHRHLPQGLRTCPDRSVKLPYHTFKLTRVIHASRTNLRKYREKRKVTCNFTCQRKVLLMF